MQMSDCDPTAIDLLKHFKLDSIDSVKSARGDVVQPERQEVLRLDAEFDARAVTLFVKRMWNNPVAVHAMWPVLLGRRIESRAAREWRNYQALRDRGIGSARPIAFGEEFGWVKEKFSYIITERVAGVEVDDFLDSCASLAERRAALVALGREIRRMHDSGICFPDLFARHIFVERDGNAFRFRLIDVSRLICREKLSQWNRAKDIAALNASVLLDRVGRTDRLRVLRAYGELHSKQFLKLIARRMRKLSGRAKFKRFFENRFARMGLNR